MYDVLKDFYYKKVLHLIIIIDFKKLITYNLFKGCFVGQDIFQNTSTFLRSLVFFSFYLNNFAKIHIFRTA